MRTARPLVARLHLRGELLAETALHVGAAGSDGVLADLVVVRDGAGRVVIPGSSLAGVLRQWSRSAIAADGDGALVGAWARAWGEDVTQTAALLLGNEPLAERDDEVAASLLHVEDAPATTTDPVVELRDHVAISADHGVANDRAKYDRLVVAPGARFALALALDVPDPDQEAVLARLLAGMRDALQDAQLRVGGSTTRGLGVVRLQHATLTVERLATAPDVIAAVRARLAGGAPGTPIQAAPAALRRATPSTTITLGFKVDGSLLVRDGAKGTAVDTLPLTTAVGNGQRRLLLPGSSVKGTLRARAERLVRTAAGIDWCSGTHERSGLPIVDTLFGHARTGSDREKTGGARGVLSVADTLGGEPFDDATWRDVADVTPAPCESCRPDVPAHKQDFVLGAAQTAARKCIRGAVARPHVAIDRWTGGAAEQRLYSVLEPVGVEWEAIVITVDAARLGGEALSAGALLLLLLRELAAGDLPLGGLVGRGHGALSEVTATIGAGSALGLPDGAFDPLTFDAAPQMRAAWQATLDATRSTTPPPMSTALRTR